MWGNVGNARWGAVGLAALLALLWASGCGSDSSQIAVIPLESPGGVGANGFLSSSVRCGSGSLWLPLKWGAVPDGTKELAIYLGHFKRDPGGQRKPVVTFADLVYHISPSLHQNEANYIPDKAQWTTVGEPSCPAPWGNLEIVQAVFAFDRTRVRHLTREEATRLTEEALKEKRGSRPVSGPPGPLREDAAGVGTFVTGYAPGTAP